MKIKLCFSWELLGGLNQACGIQNLWQFLHIKESLFPVPLHMHHQCFCLPSKIIIIHRRVLIVYEGIQIEFWETEIPPCGINQCVMHLPAQITPISRADQRSPAEAESSGQGQIALQILMKYVYVRVRVSCVKRISIVQPKNENIWDKKGIFGTFYV